MVLEKTRWIQLILKALLEVSGPDGVYMLLEHWELQRLHTRFGLLSASLPPKKFSDQIRIVLANDTPKPEVVQCTTCAVIHNCTVVCFAGNVLYLMLRSISFGGLLRECWQKLSLWSCMEEFLTILFLMFSIDKTQNWPPYVCLQNIPPNFADTLNSKFWELTGGMWDSFLCTVSLAEGAQATATQTVKRL